MRREFDIPQEEVEAFEHLYPKWEALKQDKAFWLLIHEFPVPAGYNVSSADLAVRIPEGPWGSKLDMVFVFPELRLMSGRPIPNVDGRVNIDQRDFQQWSRHYTWNPAQHNLSIHLQFAHGWFERELRR